MDMFLFLHLIPMIAAAEATGTDQVQAVSSHVMFLARGKVGPFRSEAEPVVASDGMAAVRTPLHDEGDGDRAVTAGSYQFRVGE